MTFTSKKKSSSFVLCLWNLQVVWAATTEVGCGLAMCSTLTTKSNSVSNAGYLVCYYNPRGNSPTPTCTWDWSPYEAAKK
ncbi:hypothetical protein RRG08_004412 [Elysia crispata]|uniref:SCP domain-containing protein n=1 Tax=Elysia crispata TaxID=231223 RepID=A0AAE0Y5Q8_9GAST|nr:hypothetical protein RRG08_004412 [Elysia crispata]